MQTQATQVELGRMLTTQEASERLSISPRLLWTYAKTGQITVTKFGRCVRFSPAAIAEFIAKNSR